MRIFPLTPAILAALADAAISAYLEPRVAKARDAPSSPDDPCTLHAKRREFAALVEFVDRGVATEYPEVLALAGALRAGRVSLYFGHHQAVTVAGLSLAEQDEILDLAEQNRWGRTATRDEVKRRREVREGLERVTEAAREPNLDGGVNDEGQSSLAQAGSQEGVAIASSIHLVSAAAMEPAPNSMTAQIGAQLIQMAQ